MPPSAAGYSQSGPANGEHGSQTIKSSSFPKSTIQDLLAIFGGRYVYLEDIGKGSFGKVVRCQDTLTKKDVAVKIVDHHNIRTSRERKNLSRELRLVKILHHPNIICVESMKEHKSSTIIVMELASRGELHDYVAKHEHGLTEAETLRFFRQMISAVDYCHQSSIVHRDLKPENMLIDENNNIKLIDFGFGNTFTKGSFLTTYCGSPFYAAPEMTQGVPYTGPEVDIWSLGVILYSMLTGTLPFNGNNINELYSSIARGKYHIPSSLNAKVRDLLAGMLCVKPQHRYTMKQIKEHEWVTQGGFELDNHVPFRNQYEDLDEKVLKEVLDLGYDRSEYEKAFSRPHENGPVKSLYFLHKEWLERKGRSREMPALNIKLTVNTSAKRPPTSPIHQVPDSATSEANQSIMSPTLDNDVSSPTALKKPKFWHMWNPLKRAKKSTGDSVSLPMTPLQK